MTIGLSYLSDLSRVQIALSDLPDGTVLVERSAMSGFQLAETVRGGVELPISSGVGQLDDYEFHADAANYYRIVPVDPPAGLLLDGTSGGNGSTPDAASLDITGDLTVRVEAVLDDWDPGSEQTLAAKYDPTGDQRSWRIYIRSTGELAFAWSTDGTSGTGGTAIADTLPSPDADGRLAVEAAIDVDNGAGAWEVTFATAATIDGAFAQLGTVQVGASTTSIHGGTAPVEVGAFNEGLSTNAAGVFAAMRLYDGGTGGTLVADPDFDDQDGGTTSFADDAGNTWTVNGTGVIVGVESTSITPSLDGQVWVKSVVYPVLNTVVAVSDYGDVEPAARSAAFPIAGRSLPTGSAELHGGRDHTLILATDDPDDFAHLDLMARTGGVMFVHVPTVATPGCEGNLLLPGSMHVLIGRPRIIRLGGVSDTQHIQLPLTEVNPPGADVVGGTLMWSTIRRLYSSWSAVWAAHSSWRSIWDTIGDPSDVYVP